MDGTQETHRSVGRNLGAIYLLGGCDELLVENGLHLNVYDCVEFLGEAKCSGPLAP